MSQPDDALLTALRAARPDLGYQPSPASAEATDMITRILSTHPERDRSPRPERSDRTAVEARPTPVRARWAHRRRVRLIGGAVAAAAAATLAAGVLVAVLTGATGTTAPAPTRASLPIFLPGSIVAPAHITAKSNTSTPSSISDGGAGSFVRTE